VPMPTWLAVVASRIRGLVLARRLDDDFDRELAAHLAMLTDEQIRRGLTPDAARRAAAVQLGGAMQIKEQQHAQRGLPVVETTVQDLRYGLRSLRRNPAYALVAVATLAVGIGAGTAVFSVARAVLLRPLPYKDPSRLVRVFETNPLRNWTRNIASPANYADWKSRNTVFSGVAAYEQFTFNGSGASEIFLTGQGEPQGLKSLGVTGNLFGVLGTPPLLGRTFTDDETFEGKARVVVLTYALWQSAFGGDPGIVGRAITLSGRTYDVVGVMPRDFFFPGRDVQLFVPVAYQPSVFVRGRRPHYLGAVARLKPDVSLQRAQQEMDAIARGLEKEYPDTNTQMGVRLEGFHDSLAYAPRPALLMLSGAVGLLFLIVCANIANLQLGRATARVRELAIRRALGAGRRRLVRQLMTESLIISVVGGGLGLALAIAARAAVEQLAASAIPVFAEIRLDRAVVIFCLALSLIAPLIFGVLPALLSSRADRLNERGEVAARDTRYLRGMLIAAEVALSIVLVVGAVLLGRSLLRLQAVDPGFDQNHVVTFTLSLPSARYANAAERLRAFEEIDRRLREQPMVQAAGAVSTLALRGYTWSGDATVEGRAATDYERELRHKSVTADYFKTMNIRLLAGRIFNDGDRIDQPRVTVVNETLAKKYFRGADALGKRIKFARPVDNDAWVTVIGVVADEKQDGLDRAAQPQAYSTIKQRTQNPLTFVVRSTLDDAGVVAMARREVQAVDRDLALTAVAPMRAVVVESMGDHRFRTILLGAFAGVALLLAALGIYGVLAYFVSQRARELGIRLALGARPSALFAMVVRQGMPPVAIGALIGLASAVALTTVMQSLLFGVDPVDPATYVAASATLAIVALAACAIPAMRATRVDPLVALRDE
jgi:putative ABC transport system permease protein